MRRRKDKTILTKFEKGSSEGLLGGTSLVAKVLSSGCQRNANHLEADRKCVLFGTLYPFLDRGTACSVGASSEELA